MTQRFPHVALLTEGTYPLYGGGVSVWCDQLVSGLAHVKFDVAALSGFGTPVTCALPPNVREVRVVPLWEPLTARRPAPARRATFQEIYARLIGALLSDTPAANLAFTGALHDLSVFAVRGDLNAALADRDNPRVLLDAWRACKTAAPGDQRVGAVLPAPSVTDALDAAMWLAHLLRPLAHALPGCDLSHAVSNGLAVLPALATQSVYGTPFILTEHGMYLRERYLSPPSEYLSAGTRAFLLRFYMHLTRTAYQQAALVSPASNFNTRWQLHFGADPAKLRPVYNGVDPELFLGGDTEPGVPTVAWVGRIDPIKDLDTLIRSHALLQHHLPEAQLRMFGPVPQGNEAYKRACLQLIHDLGLDSAAHFEGRVPSVAQAYQSGHVVALSSISEGFPYSVIEAMAAGRPMVATDVGGVREAVGDTGLVVPPRDPHAFAEACQELLRDDGLRRRLSQRARDRVRTLFTLQRCLDAYRTMYDELCIHAAPAAVGA